VSALSARPLHWSASYIGMPFRELGRTRGGADCWGLTCIVYAEQLAIDLPPYLGLYTSVEERAEISAIVDGAIAEAGTWAIVDHPQEFDIAVIRQGKYGSHVGILISPRQMLHMAEKASARIDDFTQPRWASRLTNIYRHRGARQRL